MLNMFTPKDRSLSDNIKLGVVFAWIGGFNNASAILLMGKEIGPMSANWAGLAKNIGTFTVSEIILIACLLAGFISGAATGTRMFKKYSYLPLLGLEVFLFMLMASLNVKGAIVVGAFAMGLQNSFTTNLSHHAVRSSHLTSTSTDIGITLARGDKDNALLRIILVGSYAWGAVGGVFASNVWGLSAFTVPAMTILGLLVLDGLSNIANLEDELPWFYKWAKILDL